LKRTPYSYWRWPPKLALTKQVVLINIQTDPSRQRRDFSATHAYLNRVLTRSEALLCCGVEGPGRRLKWIASRSSERVNQKSGPKKTVSRNIDNKDRPRKQYGNRKEKGFLQCQSKIIKIAPPFLQEIGNYVAEVSNHC